MINKAQVGGGGDAQAPTPTAVTAGACTASNAPTKGCAIDSDTVNKVSLELIKSNGGSTVTAGGTTTYTLTVTNSGNVATTGTVTVIDVMPGTLTIGAGAVALGGVNAADWSCNASGQVITCTSAVAIAAGGTRVFSFVVNVAVSATGSVTNRAQVGGGGDPLAPTPTSVTAGACSGTNTPTKGCAIETDTVNPPDVVSLGLTKVNSSSAMPAGGTTTYTLTVTNTGNISSTGTLTVVDVLPAGLTRAAGAFTPGGAQGANWNCNASGQVITCTSSTVIAVNGTSAFSVTVNVASDLIVGSTVTNRAQVGGGGDAQAPTPTPVTAGACTGADAPTKGCAIHSDTVSKASLGLVKTNGATTVTAGGTTTYTLTVTNSGNLATAGTITVVDVLPAGLTHAGGAFSPGGAQGANWSCSASGQVVTCTSSTVIGAGGSSVLSFVADVGAGLAAGGTATNRAQVGGGGDPLESTPTSVTAGACAGTDAPTKGCAIDTDTVNGVSLGLGKSNGGSTVLAGSTTTYTLTVTNGGNIGTSGTITVVDVLPAALVIADGAVPLTGANAANWSCAASSQVVTCTSPAVIAAGGSSAFGFTVGVSAGLAGGTSLTNQAQVGGGGDPQAPPPNSQTVGSCVGQDAPIKGCAIDTDQVAAATPELPIPTLGEFALMLLMLLLAATGSVTVRRGRR